jgi:hypothetical protein
VLSGIPEQTDRMVTGINGGYTASQLSLAAVNEEQAKKLAAAWAPTAAKRSLHDAVGATDPVVEELARILSAQLKALATLHELTAQNALLNHRVNHSAMVDYVEAERRAEARILRILQRILNYQEKGPNDELFNAIITLDPSAKRDNIEAREAHWLDIVKRHQAHLAAYHDRYAEYERRAGELNASRRTGAATLAKAQSAVTAWAGAHTKVRAALEKKVPPDFSAFFAAVRDVAIAFSSGAQTE